MVRKVRESETEREGGRGGERERGREEERGGEGGVGRERERKREQKGIEQNSGLYIY